MTTFAGKTRSQLHSQERDLLDMAASVITDIHPRDDRTGLRELATETFERLLTLDSEHDADYVRILQHAEEIQRVASSALS